MKFAASSKPFRSLLATLGLFALWVMAGAGLSSSAAAPAPAAAADGVWVVGNHLVKDGRPFIVKGVILAGHVAPDDLLNANQRGSRAAFGPSLLSAAKTWNVNTIRFNFSQPALDPRSSMYNEANYLGGIQSAVALARSMGFVVIVTDQDEDDSHDPDRPPVRMPTAATARADLTLVGLFKNDRGVMIELFNEPRMELSPSNWALWLNGGTYLANGTTSETMVGVQTLVSDMRAAGSRNVLLLPSLNTVSFAGVPTTLADPLNDYAYDPHLLNPSKWGGDTPADWQASFGFLADQGKPVLLGAFNASTSMPAGSAKPSSWCKTDPSLDRARQFLAFLARKKIGVVGWAFDHPGSIVADFNGTPTTYAGKKCGDADGGSGELLRAQFAAPTPSF